MQSVQNLEKIPPMMTQYFFSPSVKFAMSHFLTLSPCIGKMMATAPLYSFFLRSSSISISLAFLPTFHNCLYGRRKGGKDCQVTLSETEKKNFSACQKKDSKLPDFVARKRWGQADCFKIFFAVGTICQIVRAKRRRLYQKEAFFSRLHIPTHF